MIDMIDKLLYFLFSNYNEVIKVILGFGKIS